MAVAGRPRSREGHKAILRAAYGLLVQDGFARFTFERVAAEAGVSRSTIYRWWPSKGALAMESALGALSAELAFAPPRSPIENFRKRLRLAAQALKGRPGRIIAGMLAEGQQDPTTIDIFTTGYLEPARRNLRAILEEAVTGGFVAPDFDVETAIDVAFGTQFLHLLLHHPIDEQRADRLADLILSGSLTEPVR